MEMAVIQVPKTEMAANRPVGIMLTIGIFLFPILFAWFLLRRGYSGAARIFGFGWMSVIVALIILQPSKDESASSTTPAVDASAAPTDTEQPEFKPWLPEGFTKVSDVASKSNVKAGYQWTAAPESACEGATGCTAMTIIPAKACESLFVNLTIEDADGNNIGFTNSMATNVAKYQSAKMTFSTYVEGVQKFRIQEVSCRNY
jgi:hypothetical protein